MGGCGIWAGQGNPPVKLGGCQGVRCPPRGERALLTVLPPPPPAPAALCTALPCPLAPNPQRTLNPFSPARRGWGGPGPPPPPRGSLAALQRPYRDPIWPTAGWDQPRLTRLRNGGRGVCQFWGPQSRHRGKPGVFWGHGGHPACLPAKGHGTTRGGLLAMAIRGSWGERPCLYGTSPTGRWERGGGSLSAGPGSAHKAAARERARATRATSQRGHEPPQRGPQKQGPQERGPHLNAHPAASIGTDQDPPAQSEVPPAPREPPPELYRVGGRGQGAPRAPPPGHSTEQGWRCQRDPKKPRDNAGAAFGGIWGVLWEGGALSVSEHNHPQHPTLCGDKGGQKQLPKPGRGQVAP